MSPAAITFITYLWHYLVARLVYDNLVRPLAHGHVWTMMILCGAVLGAFAIGWWRGRRGRDGSRSPRSWSGRA